MQYYQSLRATEVKPVRRMLLNADASTDDDDGGTLLLFILKEKLVKLLLH